jgi:hypothetical protein
LSVKVKSAWEGGSDKQLNKVANEQFCQAPTPGAGILIWIDSVEGKLRSE